MAHRPSRALASLCLLAACIAPGCQGEKPASPSSENAQSHRTVRVVFQDSGGLALSGDSLQHAFIGLGAWDGPTPKATQRLAVGANDVTLPVGTTSLRATLVSHRGADEVYVARSTSNVTIAPDTQEVVVQFGAYTRQTMRNVMGILYESDGSPANDFQLSLMDAHSGAEIGIEDQGSSVTPDARGVYALRTFLNDSSLRLRVRGKTFVRDLVLPIGPSVGEGFAGLPFVNLTGSDQRSPFLLSASLLKGDKGDRGDRGESGTGAGLLVQAEPAGANCAAGGTKISTWTQAAGTSSQSYNPAAGSSNLAVSYVCAPPPGSNTTPLYANGINVGNFVSFGARTYLSTDGVYVPLFADVEPGRFQTTPPQTNAGVSFDVSKPALVFSGTGCTGTPYMLRPSSLALNTPSGAVLRAADLSAAAPRTPIVIQSAYQEGMCETQSYNLRSFASPTAVGPWLGLSTSGYDSTLTLVGPGIATPTPLRAGVDLPFRTDRSVRMVPVGGEFIANGNPWGPSYNMNQFFYRSSNGGKQWTQFSPNVTNLPSGASFPSNLGYAHLLARTGEGVLVAAMNTGVFTSQDNGASWLLRTTETDMWQLGTAALDEATNTLYVFHNGSGGHFIAVDVGMGATSNATSTTITAVPSPSYGLAAHGGIITASHYYGMGLELKRYDVAGNTSTTPTVPFGTSYNLVSCGGKLFMADESGSLPGAVQVSSNMGSTWSTLPGVTAASTMNHSLRVACAEGQFTLHYGKRLYQGDGGSTWTALPYDFDSSAALATRNVALPNGLSFPLGNLSTSP